MLIGLFIFRDYGLGMDEGFERTTGLVNLQYVLRRTGLRHTLCKQGCESDTAKNLSTYHDRTYSSWFQVLALTVEKTLDLRDMDRYFLRHLLTFLFYWAGVLHLFLSARLVTRNAWVALITMLLFILQPRFFGEAFHNPKDIVFLSVHCIAIYYILRMLQLRQSNAGAFPPLLVSGLLTGLAIATRISGILLFLLVLGCLMIQTLFRSTVKVTGRKSLSRSMTEMLSYVSTTILGTILFWPYLWSQPLARFSETVEHMRRFPWPGTVLLNGEFLKATDLPWYYIPNWISVTVPPFIIVLTLLGLLLLTMALLRRFQDPKRLLAMLLASGLVLGPIAAALAFGAVLYDGWRHLYFTAAGAFLLVAFAFHRILSISRLRNWRWPPLVLLTLVLVHSVFLCYEIIRLHPYQNVYFNSFAKRPLRTNYDMDYWGLSYRAGLEFILRTDSSKRIEVRYFGHPEQAQFALEPDGRASERLVYVEEPIKAHYFLTVYRWHPDDYAEEPVFSVERNGERILSVFKVQ
ncbi:MAG: hypothetical protein JNM27_11100 [Leptospirales bacterium]|nr:hypothetical protein [Leptospirales bacterium]